MGYLYLFHQSDNALWGYATSPGLGEAAAAAADAVNQTNQGLF